MEIRIGPCNQPCSNWEEQLQELKDIFEAASKLLFAKALPFAEMLEAIKLALGEAEQSGLFRFQQEHRNSRAPGHKLVDYNRPAHIFGPVNKFTHRHSLKLCQDEAPWGPDQPSDDVGLAGSWPVNPDLPKDVPRVFVYQRWDVSQRCSTDWTGTRSHSSLEPSGRKLRPTTVCKPSP